MTIRSACASALFGTALLGLLTGVAACVPIATQTASQSDVRVLERAGLVDPKHDAVLEEARVAVLQPIAFDGQVVDATGAPLPGARVRLTVFDQVLEPFRYPYFAHTELDEKVTGSKGLFRVRDSKGAALLVRVTKPGFVPASRSVRLFSYSSMFANGTATPPPKSSQTVLFKLVRQRDPLALVRVASGAIPIAPGQTIEYNFAARDPYGVRGAAPDLRAICEIGDRDGAKAYPWSCRFEFPDGGFTPFNPLLEDAPPVSGYETSFEVGFAAEAQEWRDRDDVEVFVKTRDGRRGRLVIGVRMAGERYFTVRGELDGPVPGNRAEGRVGG